MTCLTREWMTLALRSKPDDPEVIEALQAVHSALSLKRPNENKEWRDEYVRDLSLHVNYDDACLS